MQYHWETILAPDETIEKEFTISRRYRMLALIVLLIVGVLTAVAVIYAGVLIALLGVLYWFYLTKAKHYAFTKKRVILVDSFVGTTITSIDYSQITDITVVQSLLDQIGGWGTLIIDTAGTHADQTRLSFIPNPQAVKQQLDSIRDTAH